MVTEKPQGLFLLRIMSIIVSTIQRDCTWFILPKDLPYCKGVVVLLPRAPNSAGEIAISCSENSVINRVNVWPNRYWNAQVTNPL